MINIQKNIMVCVTQQITCERLILAGYNMMNENDKLHIIHVVNENDKFLYNYDDGEALEYLFEVSKKVGADLSVIRSKDVVKAILDYTKNEKVTNIVLGASTDIDDENSHFSKRIKNAVPNAELIIV